MNTHRKKMIAPIVVTVLLVLYYTFYFGFIISMLETTIGKLLLGIIPMALAGVTIGVCIQRIHEIQDGEEDDLDQY